MYKLRNSLEEEICQKKKLEEEMIVLRSQLLQATYEADQVLLIRSHFIDTVINYFSSNGLIFSFFAPIDINLIPN